MVKNDPEQERREAERVRNNPSYQPTLAGGLIDQALAERQAQLERGHDYGNEQEAQKSEKRTRDAVMEALETTPTPTKSRTKLFSTKSANPKYLADKPGHERLSVAEQLDRKNKAMVEKNGHVIGGNKSLALTHEAAANADTFIATKEPAKAPATFAEDMAARRAAANPLGLSGSFNHTATATPVVAQIADPALDLAANRPVFKPSDFGLNQA